VITASLSQERARDEYGGKHQQRHSEQQHGLVANIVDDPLANLRRHELPFQNPCRRGRLQVDEGENAGQQSNKDQA